MMELTHAGLLQSVACRCHRCRVPKMERVQEAVTVVLSRILNKGGARHRDGLLGNHKWEPGCGRRQFQSEHHRLGLRQRTLISHSSVSWKSKIMGPAWLGSGEDSLPGLQTVLCPHMVERALVSSHKEGANAITRAPLS